MHNTLIISAFPPFRFTSLHRHQNPQQLSANLWAAVRARGCQFLGPAMQEEVLKLILLALEDGSALSRKVLVLFVVQRLEPHYPQVYAFCVRALVRCSMESRLKQDGNNLFDGEHCGDTI